jgi:hypothetical protein
VDQFSNSRKTLASKVPKSTNVIRNGTVHRSRFSTQEYFIFYQENPRISLFYFPIHLTSAFVSFATVTVGKSKAFGCI